MAHSVESREGALEEELFVPMTMGDDGAVRETYVAGREAKGRAHGADGRGRQTAFAMKRDQGVGRHFVARFAGGGDGALMGRSGHSAGRKRRGDGAGQIGEFASP